VVDKKIEEAIDILQALGMPRAQLNERSGLCLLALLNMTKTKKWASAENPLVGITPMMEFALKENCHESLALHIRHSPSAYPWLA
jgi:type II restriction enzyme